MAAHNINQTFERFQGESSAVVLSEGRCTVVLTIRRIDDFLEGGNWAPSAWVNLKPGVVEYLRDIVDETSNKVPELSFIFRFSPDVDLGERLTIENLPRAITGFFSAHQIRMAREVRQHFRDSLLMLGWGLVFMLVCTMLRTSLAPEEHLSLMSSFREGLLVIGWVALWRPIEELLFNWWPLKREERLWRKLKSAHITVNLIEQN